ncbi:hypothetical protein EJ08DRAFT_640875 [Tothia fuscella]|uniref:Heterokaryon incompatibility domain-containing protein n=1 Tax=Tothia fuscella TaxID=1048955 RepID=A0A9P4TU28_9PEZI|nr:hypothetical protein EJ08DRAFT_640875 [Tothia fuscella]
METQPEFDNFYTPQNSQFYSEYKYSKLDAVKHEIRLLRLHPRKVSSSNENQFHCEVLNNVPIAKIHGRYSAVSYYSGDPQNTHVISIDGIKFNAFANLWTAIAQVFLSWKKDVGVLSKGFREKELLLWADQICINQSDPEERSQQVGYMLEIYARAEQIFVSIPTKDTVLENLETARTSLSQNYLGVSPYRQHAAKWHPVYDILEHPWWNRAWIYQEFIVASRAYFMFGHGVYIAWAEFARLTPAFELCLSVHDQSFQSRLQTDSLRSQLEKDKATLRTCRLEKVRIASLQSATSTVLSILGAKRDWKGPVNLSTLLSHGRKCRSSELRDKVYAFIGLAHDMYSIIPNYSTDNRPVDVFIAATSRIIECEQNLDILREAQGSRGSAHGIELPSWVPDWSEPDSTEARELREHLCFPADRKKFSNHEPEFSFETRGPGRKGAVLKVKGCCVAILPYPSIDLDASWRVFKIKLFGTDESVATTQRAQQGDELWIFWGSTVPFLLRKHDEDYILIGEALLGTQRKGLSFNRIYYHVTEEELSKEPLNFKPSPFMKGGRISMLKDEENHSISII